MIGCFWGKGIGEWLSRPSICNIPSLSRNWFSYWSFLFTVVSLSLQRVRSSSEKWLSLSSFISLLYAVIKSFVVRVTKCVNPMEDDSRTSPSNLHGVVSIWAAVFLIWLWGFASRRWSWGLMLRWQTQTSYVFSLTSPKPRHSISFGESIIVLRWNLFLFRNW